MKIDTILSIVIPAAGAGRRFQEAGFELPKPFIDIYGLPMLARVMYNVAPLMPHRFVVLLRREHHELWCKLMPPELQVKTIVRLVDNITEGAACTVLLAKDLINNHEPLLLCNADQLVFFSDNTEVVSYHEWIDDTTIWATKENSTQDLINHTSMGLANGCIATFKSNHPKWSYVEVDKYDRVARVAEKVVISEHATVGLYYFTQGRYFVQAAESMIAANRRVNGEFYVCPVFNELIANHNSILTYPIKRMFGLGTPEDLRDFFETVGREDCFFWGFGR